VSHFAINQITWSDNIIIFIFEAPQNCEVEVLFKLYGHLPHGFGWLFMCASLHYFLYTICTNYAYAPACYSPIRYM
jgi:hypothetical protein